MKPLFVFVVDSCWLDHFPGNTLAYRFRVVSSVTSLIVQIVDGMYLSGKVDISKHLAIPRFPKNDHTAHWEELLQSVSDCIFSKHCGCTPRGVRGVKGPEIL